jgi:uncharacterized protein YcaQ
MTELLEKAFAEASKLPRDAQNMLARMLLDELVAEEKWDDAFAQSQNELARLAVEASDEHKSGKTKTLEEIL